MTDLVNMTIAVSLKLHVKFLQNIVIKSAYVLHHSLTTNGFHLGFFWVFLTIFKAAVTLAVKKKKKKQKKKNKKKWCSFFRYDLITSLKIMLCGIIILKHIGKHLVSDNFKVLKMFDMLVRKPTAEKYRAYIFKYLTHHKIKMCFNFIANEEVL